MLQEYTLRQSSGSVAIPTRPLDRSTEAIALAERVSHPLTLVLAQQNLSNVHLMRREPGEGRRWLEKWTPRPRNSACSISISQGRFYLGWVLAEEGRQRKASAEMREGIAVIGHRAANGMPYYLCVLRAPAANVVRRARDLTCWIRA